MAQVTSRPGELLTFARGELLGRAGRARERVWLASPFLTAPVANHLVSATERSSATDLRLLTALVPGSVQLGFLDPQALLILDRCGFDISNIDNLHAKLAIVDASWSLVGSGNLTNAGLGGVGRGNVELGVVLDRAQVEVAATLFSGWWSEAEPVSEQRIRQLDALPRVDDRSGGVEVGEGPTIDTGQTQQLEAILAEDDETAQARNYWLKANHHRPDAVDWWHRNWISDWRRAPYDVGDLLVLYLSGRDGGPSRCPAIVEVVERSRHDPEWIAARGDAAAAEHWPYMTKTAFVADVPIQRGVPLSLIGVSPQGMQNGYRSITRGEFEQIAAAMMSVCKGQVSK